MWDAFALSWHNGKIIRIMTFLCCLVQNEGLSVGHQGLFRNVFVKIHQLVVFDIWLPEQTWQILHKFHIKIFFLYILT